MSTRLLYLPGNIVSLLVGWLAHLRLPSALLRRVIRVYCAFYRIDPSSCTRSLSEFASLADFFVREMKPELRPVNGPLVSPVDGVLRDFGSLDSGELSHIKGRRYSVEELLQSSSQARLFRQGFYLNFYLSPADCHHVFCPLAGEVFESVYIPGGLLPVNDFTFRRVSRLFCLNERLVTYIRSDIGTVALVMVGAMCVGQMGVTYDSWRTNTPRSFLDSGGAQVRDYQQAIRYVAGQKLGTFCLGSSVVLLFERKPEGLGKRLAPGMRLYYGSALVDV